MKSKDWAVLGGFALVGIGGYLVYKKVLDTGASFSAALQSIIDAPGNFLNDVAHEITSLPETLMNIPQQIALDPVALSLGGQIFGIINPSPSGQSSASIQAQGIIGYIDAVLGQTIMTYEIVPTDGESYLHITSPLSDLVVAQRYMDAMVRAIQGDVYGVSLAEGGMNIFNIPQVIIPQGNPVATFNWKTPSVFVGNYAIQYFPEGWYNQALSFDGGSNMRANYFGDTSAPFDPSYSQGASAHTVYSGAYYPDIPDPSSLTYKWYG